MKRHDAMTEELQQVRLGDKIMLFTDLRLDKDSVPDGVYRYETRHEDGDGWNPVQVGLGVWANFYGTLLTNEPLALDKDGFADIADGTFEFLHNGTITLPEFLQGKEPFLLTYCNVQEEDFARCYSDNRRDKELGCVGHLRADFGDKEGFFSSWNDHCPELNTEAFRANFDRTMNVFRKYELKDFATMSQYCSKNLAKRLPDRFSRDPAFVSKRKSGQYEYYLRMTPQKGAYHVYLYCYDLEARAKYQERQPMKTPQKHRREDYER